MIQWLRIFLPMQGTWFRSLIWEDPTCCRTAKPARHNSWGLSTHAQQQEKVLRSEPKLHSYSVAPLTTARESLCAAIKSSGSQKKQEEEAESQLKQWMNDLNKHHTKEGIWKPINMKRDLWSFASRKMQINPWRDTFLQFYQGQWLI